MKFVITSLLLASTAFGQTSTAPSPSGSLPFSVSVYDRTRADASQWFASPPQDNTYGYVESLVRIGIAQRIQHFDWQLELSQPAMLDLPSHSISPITAAGQLGLGATYYSSNTSNAYPAAASLKQGYLRYHFGQEKNNIRVGRFEFFDGQETQPKNASLLWLQTNRVAQRLVGNFGFSNGQRSFDGLDAHLGGSSWDLTAMTGRADQGVFNMNGNPELNVDLQYLALSRYELKQHLLWRVFGIGYHDGRTGLTKTDNRALAVRAADHHNIRIGTYGGDVLTILPVSKGQFDFLAWGVLQNGNWGLLHHSAGAVAAEGGFQFTKIASSPWIRGGFFRGTGDNNATDNQHNTFFQVLPTPRVYSRFPFYNQMDSEDQFVQLVDKPSKRIELRSDLHWLQLTSNKDLWYQGGGAFDNKVFGYTGRPAGGHSSFASVADLSADWQATQSVAFNFYYAHVWGKSVVAAIYPTDHSAQFGYVEMVYRWKRSQSGVTK
ncbi:alginate export family protein [Granulicella arctica]|uniref:Alginate export domain-containing protein n=1 Tax=Granulicella arctica TaxID=940613 RepID=A0A7Y9PEA4_9BACT|nr:alginate export family protein [Granulicella arctica]NYF78337.1 hypothetical protein [Granulicella arctica]